MTLWYAHQRCTALLMIGSGDTLRPYDARGWTTFEASVARFLKLSLPFMWPAVIVSGEDEALMHADACPRSQQPPIPPEDFAELMATKHFTNGKEDQDLVSGMYADDMHAASSRTTTAILLMRTWRRSRARSPIVVACAGSRSRATS